MLFNSIEFFIFLPLVFILYWFVTNKSLKLQNIFLLVASYLFYGWWDWRFLSLIIFSSFVDYYVGVSLGKTKIPHQRKVLLWISIIVNLGFLGFFKYYNFFTESFADAFTFFGSHIDSSRLNIILPVGISFYTFQTLSYSIDVYKRKLEPTKDIIAFFAFVSFFPQLVAGPIERATNLLPQFYKKRQFDYDKAVDGMRQILWGLFKKIVIADNAAMYANDIFNNYEDYSGSTLLLGAVFFAFQIYGDFSGYSDIAIGTSRLFGFNLKQNFAFPYFSRDIAEFWRRWHKSLSTWFRDYLYIPLGGSKGGTWMKTLIKLFSLKFIASLLGVGYSILQVRYFGASRTIEIYFAAQSLVYLVTSLTQSGQLAEIFLPEYHKLNNITPKLGFQGLNVVINRMLLWGTLIMAIVFIFAPFFINLLVPGFDTADKEQATLIFRILLPYLYLQLLNSFFITVLNAEKKFGRAELLGLTNTIVNILILVLLYKTMGIWALVISLLLGKIIEFIFYVSQLYRIGYQYKLQFSIAQFNHKEFFKTMKSTFTYVGATQFYSIVLTASISFLPEGTFAIFKYVQNLANKVKGLFIQPFMTVFFTEYSLLLQKGKSVTKEFNKYLGGIININTITIIGTILLGDLIIDLIWGGKKFDESNVYLAYIFLMFNISAVLISSVSQVYRKMAVAHGKGKKIYYYWVFAQLLSAGFSYFLIKYFKVNGLFFIIPINGLLMGIASYVVYKQTEKSIKYNFFNTNNVFALLAVGFAIAIKNVNFSFESKVADSIILLIVTLVLSIYPLINTYKLFKK